jgi:pimeloyl-ACP methyl ester carboxylesterase
VSQLHVTRRGSGPVVVLVHGVGMPARMAWYLQKPLAERYELWLVDRRGYGNSPPVKRQEDFEVDGADLLDLVPAGAHLVAISYGSLGALVMAAQDPHRLASLTLVECPAFSMAPGDAACQQAIRDIDALQADRTLSDAEFFNRFTTAIGAAGGFTDPLPEPFDATVPIIRGHRVAWDYELALDPIARAGVPTLVVTSGEHDAFDAVGDHLAATLNARHERISGHGHLVPLAADQFNATLDDFLKSVAVQGAHS